MKKIAFFVAIVAVLGTPAFADMKITLADGLGSTDGGEFLATVVGTSAIGENAVGSTFSTFCVETNEGLSFGPTYTVTIDTVAIAGGSGGPTPDPLDPRSAYLYNKWLDGGIAHTPGNADALQNALWYIEQEGGVNNALVAEAATAVAGAWGNTIGLIRVMNLTDATGALKQSLLVRAVPIPASILLGFLGLGAAGLKLRKSV